MKGRNQRKKAARERREQQRSERDQFVEVYSSALAAATVPLVDVRKITSLYRSKAPAGMSDEDVIAWYRSEEIAGLERRGPYQNPVSKGQRKKRR